MTNGNLQLIYTLLCDDVRLEMGNKISLMGVFQNIMVEKLPISLIKFAVVNHWRGDGNHQTEVRILAPDKNESGRHFAADRKSNSRPADLPITSAFSSTSFFRHAGTYWVQTLANTVLLEEFPLIVTDAGAVSSGQPAEEISETVN